MEYTFSAKLQNLKPSAIREIFKSLSDPSIIAFAAGNPSPESFPVEELATISAQIYKDNPISALQYSITEGYYPLRTAITERIKRKFNIGRDFDSTIVVSGGTQGIELTAKVPATRVMPLFVRIRLLSELSMPSVQTESRLSVYLLTRESLTPICLSV